MVHQAVLPDEVLTLLDPQPGQIIVDATLGVAGHASLIIDRLRGHEKSLFIGLDQDASMLEIAEQRLKEKQGDVRVLLIHANFDRLHEILAEQGIGKVDAVLADLGFCSDQLADTERGLSFMTEGPLDMRLNREEGEPASAFLQRLGERELADVIFQYGEERHSRRIARKIVEARKRERIETTNQLADLVRSCVPRGRFPGAIDPATRTFQALRIAVNDELGALDRFLEQLPLCVKPAGRAAIISFHSLEDRRVKQAFRERDLWDVQTKKPVEAGEDEITRNPRSRSAKLRVAARKE